MDPTCLFGWTLFVWTPLNKGSMITYPSLPACQIRNRGEMSPCYIQNKDYIVMEPACLFKRTLYVWTPLNKGSMITYHALPFPQMEFHLDRGLFARTPWSSERHFILFKSNHCCSNEHYLIAGLTNTKKRNPFPSRAFCSIRINRGKPRQSFPR